VKYGQKARLTVKTKEALQCKVIVKLSSVDWNENDYHFGIVDVRYKLTDAEGNHFDGIQYDFTPETRFLKEGSTVKNKMYADIWLLHPFVENLRVKSWFGQNHHLFDMHNKTAAAGMMVFDTTTVKCTPKYPDAGNYLLKENGEIELLEGTENNFDMLIAEDGSSIKVHDQKLLPQLANPDPRIKEARYGEYKKPSERTMLTVEFGTTSSQTDAMNVFEFAATHSPVEWGIRGMQNGTWIVGTLREGSQAPSFRTVSEYYNIINTLYDAHSHGGKTQSYDFIPSGEDNATGWIYLKNNPKAQMWLFMPHNPNGKWKRIYPGE
ncbi:MAG: hypothetical protein LBV74_16495, partial [Tannerella sp.]|nr:hypothetical protein [Tannerella sp.]